MYSSRLPRLARLLDVSHFDVRPESLLLCQSCFFFLFSFLLEFVVAHGHDGQDQVDQVERPQEDDHHEEDDVPRTGRS
jgi:hypothetical protein